MTQTKIHVDIESSKGTISPHIYGHFAEHLGRCIYDGFWVGEDTTIDHIDGIRRDIVEALRKINIPVLRWPGGCFADEYHWKDGVGPKADRKRLINTHWGGVVENNHFGTHEFLQLCELLDCEPYVVGNVGSGSVVEMQEWVEYMTFGGESPMSLWREKNGRKQPWPIKYYGVGNENWGCGGNMRPEFYADLYRQFQTYVRNFGDNKIYRIACGANSFDYEWTEVLMRQAGKYMDGLSLHYYTVPGEWAHKGSATQFGEADWFTTLQKALVMDDLVQKHSDIMDKYDPEKRVGMIVDEWGTWYDVEPGTNPGFLFQQNSLRDALVAGLTLNIFNNHCDRVYMANLAQTINVLQALVLTEGDKMILTPTYHVFDMYQVHQGAKQANVTVEKGAMYQFGDQQIPQLTVSASHNEAETLHVTLCNLDHQNGADVALSTTAEFSQVNGRVLTAPEMQAHNTFDQPDTLRPTSLDNISIDGESLTITLPPMSVVLLTLNK